jgi:DNA relaxase NicK
VDIGIRFLLMECGVDWMTATAGSGARANTLAGRGRAYVEERGTEGYQIKPWFWNGYRGEVVDGCSWGKRDDGVIIRVSASMARRHWKSILVFADNVSRFDIQTTVLDRESKEDLARTAFARAQENSQILNGTVKTAYTVNTPEGSTLTLGSRSSDRFLRLYNKTAETDHEYPNTCWRWEVEYKGRRAYKVANDVNVSKSEAAACHNRVRTCFGSYGVRCAGEEPTFGWRDAGIVRSTDDQRRLEWVKRCIRPTIGRLVEAYDSETIAKALGLTIYPSSSDPLAVEWRAAADDDKYPII